MNTPVYFISDVHLSLTLNEDEKERRKKFYKLLDKICETGGSCFFVGDLFDFYFEYSDLIPKAYSDFYDKAITMKKKNVKLYFLTGNHDYWYQEFLETKIMDKIYTDDVKLDINGKKFYITHGDGILSWDHGYRFLKKIIRSKIFIQLFSFIHPTISYKIARFISRSGYNDNHSKDFNKNVRTELKNFAKKYFDKKFDYMISGHYHLGEMFTIDNGQLAVLGDWFNNPCYAMFDGNELFLLNCIDND
tara:strand:- start:2181 stop:2921 length:741 start_codon:yes stop_codon:yes gene_type:complete